MIETRLKSVIAELQRLSQQIHLFTVTDEYERVSNIVQLQKTFQLPHEWPLPQEIHCISTTVTSGDSKPDKTYVGPTENTFKTRLANHKASFNNPIRRTSTELSKHVWNLKDSNINFRITWIILKRAIAYKPSSKGCNLCLWEKYFITCKPHLTTINKRNELVTLFRLTDKFLLKNFRSSFVTQYNP